MPIIYDNVEKKIFKTIKDVNNKSVNIQEMSQAKTIELADRIAARIPHLITQRDELNTKITEFQTQSTDLEKIITDTGGRPVEDDE